MREHRLNLHQRRFRFGSRRNFFMGRVFRCWKGLLRELVEPLFPQLSKE